MDAVLQSAVVYNKLLTGNKQKKVKSCRLA
jgi:hypothetical protein